MKLITATLQSLTQLFLILASVSLASAQEKSGFYLKDGDRVVFYGDSITDDATGVLFRDPAELHDRLLGLLADPAGARAIADRARAEVARHRMAAYQTARRAAWYRSLWARREELTAALFARVPELRP